MAVAPLPITFAQDAAAIFAIRVLGTSPLIVAHQLAWDIAGYWEQQPPEVGKRKIKRASIEQVALLKQLQIEYVAEDGLTSHAEAHLRGHWLPDARPGFPGAGFMGAIRTAAVQYQGRAKDRLTGKKIAAAFQVLGDASDPSLVAVEGPFRVREDIATNSGFGGAPRVATRLMFDTGWQAELRIKYLPRLMTDQQIVQLIAWSGDFGIGQWRPSSPKGGTFGTYSVMGEG
jgi:hypothetical protein